MQVQKTKEKIIISITLLAKNSILSDYFEVLPVASAHKIHDLCATLTNIAGIVLDQSDHADEWRTLTYALKRNAKTFHCVIIIIVKEITLEGLTQALEAGADDYMSVPATPHELAARIMMSLRRAQRDQNANPLTKLPGNGAIMYTLHERLDQPLALLFIDLDNFKAYNDYYGFARGDDLLKKTAHIVITAVKNQGSDTDFVGHLGGDDFMVVSTPEHALKIAQEICSTFDAQVSAFYDESDFEQCSISIPNRQGTLQTFPLITLSIAIVSNATRPVSSTAQISQIAAELKCYAKTSRNRPTGSWYVKDRRRT